MGIRAGVAGGSGYAGGELLRLLAAHPEIEVGPVTAGTSAGQPVTSVHRHLAACRDLIFSPTDPDLLATADLVFLALPAGESAALAARLPAEVKLVDLGP